MARRSARRGFILLPVVLLLSLVAAMAFLGHRETALASATAGGSRDMDKARYAAEAGLQRVTLKMHEKGCGGSYPIILFSALQDNAFDGGKYYAYAGKTSGSPVTLSSTGTYGDAQITLTRADVPMHQTSAVTMTLQPASEGVDTQIVNGSATHNGSLTTMASTAGSAWGMLRFDLTTLPAGSHVTSATLSSYTTAGSGSGTVALHRVMRDWTEAATWTTSDGSTAWSQAGGDVHTTAVASTAFAGAGTWLAWDVTALADRWIKGSLPNQGVQIRAGAGITGLQLASSDHATAGNRPRLAVTFLPPCGWTPPSTTVALNPTADTDIDGDAGVQTMNFGADVDVYVSRNHEARGLLQFDVSAIPAGKTVQSATLRMYFRALATPYTKLTQNLSVDVYAVSMPWLELEATWKRRLAGTSWTTSGGDYVSTAITNKALAKDMAPGQWVEFTVTAQVQAWVDGVSSNNGFLLRLPAATTALDELVFSSRQATSNPPELVVTYK
jgi:hypothetical protein